MQNRVSTAFLCVSKEIFLADDLDTYERIIEDDVKKSAVIIAAAVYQLAMREEFPPRYKADMMP